MAANVVPKHAKSQKQKILEYMQRGNAITWQICYDEFQCRCLAQRIQDLKDEGWDIRTNMLTLTNKKRVAEYYLPNSTPQQTKLF